jgi:uncharacterized protein
MAVYLSPGVFTNEIDLSVLPAGNTTSVVPAFIGTANKGPMNTPTLITTAEQFVDTFGSPTAESDMGYAVIGYLEEGNRCYILRVGVEFETGMEADLAAIAIDVTGSREEGWGRIAVFSGIDNGSITLRTPTAADPIVIHTATAAFSSYTDADGGDADAQIVFDSTTFNGCIDDIYTLTITSDPDITGGEPLNGAGYSIIDGAGNTVRTGTLISGSDATTSQNIVGIRVDEDGSTLVDNGLDFYVEVIGSGLEALGTGDTFVFTARPDNTAVQVSVEDVAQTAFNLTAGTYNTSAAFVAQFIIDNPGANDYTAIEVSSAPVLRTESTGEWIQLTGTCAFATEVGVSQWAYDIPRSYLLGEEEDPYLFSTANNRVVVDIIGQTETLQMDVTISTGSKTAAQTASIIDAAGTINGTKHVDSLAITLPSATGGTDNLLIITNLTNASLSQLQLQATFTYLATLRFAEEVGIVFPYTRPYESYSDAREILPTESTVTPGSPASCDAGASSQCTLDTAYYSSIVGWLVAKSAGSWSDDYTVTLEVWQSDLEDSAGTFSLLIYNDQGVLVDRINEVSFDASEDRYIGNIVDAGSTIGGVNGNAFLEWIAPPSTVLTEARTPAPFTQTAFDGGEDGIPTDAADSAELDRVVIGNPGLATGMYAFQNQETYPITLLMTPGFSSGSVIGQGLQFCENRGDVLYIIDPPFGLRPQQIIDWHNGMLTSDLTAAINSSYGALYWSWLKITDQFAGGTIWVPPSGHIGSVFARTARVSEMWFAPAGINRGRLLTALDVEYNPTMGERDSLYGNQNAVNSIVNFANEGITVWGQKTLQRTSSALDRVNVRMLLSFLKVEMGSSLKSFIFEQNDPFTRASVDNLLNAFLADIAARRGLTAFKVIVDETNNTPERIDRNELWVTVFIQPTRAIEFIVLNLVVLRTGASFSAQEVLAAGGVVQI